MAKFRTIRNPTLIFATAFVCRLLFLLILFRAVPVQRVWDTGYEACHIAASIASGHGFASPFGVPTGPSAWVPPAYAGIIALLFKVFGTYSAAAAWTALLLNALFAGATSLTIYADGEKILRHNVGVIAGWIWALSPYAIIMSLKLWETSLSALLVMAGSLLYWRLIAAQTSREWAMWGLFWGCAVLTNPVLGIFFLVLSVGAAWQCRKHSAIRLTITTLVFCALVAPWIARNYSQFHSFVPIRSNFGEELWLGNHENVNGPNDETLHPLGDRRELAAYRELGEPEYIAEKQRAANAFIREHPGEFLRLTRSRIWFFWTSPRGSLWDLISVLSFIGLVFAMRKDILQALPFATALLLYPAGYYVTHSDNWYRHPIEPVMMTLTVYALVSVLQLLRSRPSKLSTS